MRHGQRIRHKGAVSLIWSEVNHAFFLMWFKQLLMVITDRAEAISEFNRITREENQ